MRLIGRHRPGSLASHALTPFSEFCFKHFLGCNPQRPTVQLTAERRRPWHATQAHLSGAGGLMGGGFGSDPFLSPPPRHEPSLRRWIADHVVLIMGPATGQSEVQPDPVSPAVTALRLTPAVSDCIPASRQRRLRGALERAD